MRATRALAGERSGTCLQDTLKTSLCANRLFPTARLSCKQLPDPSQKRRLAKSSVIREHGSLLQMLTGALMK
jgi:hypothetical protein